MSEARLGTRERTHPTRTDTLLSVGVEEEFLLVDRVTGALADRAPDVLADAETTGVDLQAEVTLSQVETASGVCLTMPDLREQLVTARTVL
ncbi:glutamate--cysteine ligase, partial [Kibdelosporangium lantanae]